VKIRPGAANAAATLVEDLATIQLPHTPATLYGTPLITTSSTTTLLVTPDVLYATPFYAPKTRTYKFFGIEITTGSTAAGTARLGIYNNASGAPSTLVLDAGTVVTDTASFAAASISQELTSGWYWLAGVFANLATNATVRATVALPNGLHWLGATSGTDITIHPGWSVAFAFAALPDPFTPGGALMTSTVPFFKMSY
jgi:hypothetical protein